MTVLLSKYRVFRALYYRDYWEMVM